MAMTNFYVREDGEEDWRQVTAETAKEAAVIYALLKEVNQHEDV
jgi:hypothetical protein